MSASDAPTILFSAFESSGDRLAAPLIHRLRQHVPDTKVFALGGPLMQTAGAELLEDSAEQSVIGFNVLAKFQEHRRRLAELRKWLEANRIDLFVPVDSPAANWSVCNLVRKLQPHARIVHVVLPQIWAWARWRIRKLRRLTDHVICILPFEPQWLEQRGVAGTFVGHPIFDALRDQPPPTHGWEGAPQGQTRIAVLPGSRRSEIERNWPTLLDATHLLQQRLPDAVFASAAVHPRAAEQMREVAAASGRLDVFEPMALQTDATDAVLAWSTHVLAASGTVTLQITAHRKPMVVMYRLSWMTLLIGSMVMHTRVFSLPNVLEVMAGRDEVVPEFIPHRGSAQPLADAVEQQVRDAAATAAMVERLDAIATQFESHRYAEEATQTLLARGLGR